MIEINNKKLCESCFSEIGTEQTCPCCGFNSSEFTPDPMVLPLGTKLNDKIIIGKVMGKGGFGITYLSYDLRMDKTIAVKEYYPNGISYRVPGGTEVAVADAKSAEAFEKGAEKFYNEAQMVSQFNGNPNIVSVYDYFRMNSTVYLIMEYLNGITLKNYVKKHGTLNDGQALYVMDKIVAALSITHSAGVLHRDISPDNVMICSDGKIKLIDFGAARQILTESTSNLTVVMKPGYTPIEQYTKKGKQGAWTDIYSLGVSVYYALTGVIIDDPYVRMDDDSELADNKHGINNDLWTILKKCTMINASDRYGSAIDLRKALRSVSAPIKAEPISLTENDLKADSDSNGSEKSAADTPENEFPATAIVTEVENEEPIEVFDDKPEESAVSSSPVENSIVKLPSEGSSDNKGKHRKAFIIGGICAAVAVIGVTVGLIFGLRSPKTVNTSSDSTSTGDFSQTSVSTSQTEVSSEQTTSETVIADPGEEQAVSIPKSWLNEYEGDIRVTLKTRYEETLQDPDGNYYHCVRVLADGGKDIDVIAPSLAKDEYYFFNVMSDGMDLVFVIPSELRGQIKNRVFFELNNIIVDSICLEDDTYDKDIEIDNEHPNGNWGLGGFIPKSELESFGSDVRVCYELEAELMDTSDPSYLVLPKTAFFDPVSISADNHVLAVRDAMYPIDREGKYKFSFMITRDEIATLPDEGLAVQVHNVLPLSVSLKGLSEDPQKRMYIPLGTDNPGEWQFDNSHTISKEILKQFTGDIKVVLDIETVEIFKNDNNEYWHCLQISDRREAAINVNAPNRGKDFWNNYGINDGATTFTFILPKDEMPSIYKEIQFAAENTIIHGATLYDYDPDEYKISPDAKVITLTSDVDKVDEHYCLQSPPSIPKNELESFGSDVKVTLTIKQLKQPGNADDIEPYDCFIQPWSFHFVLIEADNTFLLDDCYFLGVRDVPDTFTFVISKSEISKLDNEMGLALHCRNLRISSAALEKVE